MTVSLVTAALSLPEKNKNKMSVKDESPCGASSITCYHIYDLKSQPQPAAYTFAILITYYSNNDCLFQTVALWLNVHSRPSIGQ